ncbi:MAG: metallophosphoesterase [Sphingomonas sp.]|uniref:metallophosphoesterase n=1 Tax=Sphingomonas sp. TaxID=28214 RepID=UPI003F7E12E1
MDFTLPDGTTVHLIGDPHLGKKFEVGVPLHRRGEREARQLMKFRKELDHDSDIIVMVGDLFEHPYISYQALNEAMQAILSAAEARPSVRYIMMAGNHDLPQRMDGTGAFHVFTTGMSNRLDNLDVVTRPNIICGIALFPWEWDRTALDQVSDLQDGEAYAAIGHWDLQSFGKDDHLAPTAALRRAFGEIELYSGHDHNPGDYEVDGWIVHCTGSLEPYSHSQDPAGSIYVTLTPEQALERNDLHDKFVRLLVAPGEDMPELDCLALTKKVVRKDEPEMEAGETVSLDNFDWGGILKRKIKPLHPEVQAFIEERLPHHEESTEE